MLSDSNISRVFRGDFLKLWTGQLISNFGDQFFFMGLMAVILYRMDLGAGYIGLLMVMMAIPTLIFGPIAGSYVDRWNRKHTMMMADIIRGLIVLSLMFYSELWYIYASIFMLATFSRFFYPAQNAIIPDIVDKDMLMSANSFSQTTYMLSTIIGPGIGAAMIGLFGIDSVFLFDSISFFISALFILSMRFKGTVKEKEGEKNVWKETMDGIRFSFRTPVIRTIMLYVFILLLFFGGTNPLFVVFIRDVLHMGLFQLGIIQGLQGTGALIASVTVGIVGGAFSKRNMVLGASITIGSALCILVIIPQPLVMYQAMAFFGISSVFFNTPFTTMIQEAAPDKIRGRVFGAFGALIQIAILTSMAVESMAAALVGVSAVMLAVGLSVIMFSIAFFSVKKNREVFDKADKKVTEA